MAEINIQRRPSTAIWWIIGIIALAVIVWMLLGWSTQPEITSFEDASGPVALILSSGNRFA